MLRIYKYNILRPTRDPTARVLDFLFLKDIDERVFKAVNDLCPHTQDTGTHTDTHTAHISTTWLHLSAVLPRLVLEDRVHAVLRHEDAASAGVGAGVAGL